METKTSIVKAPIAGELMEPTIEPRNRLARREQKKRRGKGSGYLFQRGDWWYLQYYVAGKKHVEAAKTKVKQEAQAMLNTRLGKIAEGIQPSKPSKPICIAELYDAFLVSKQTACKPSTVAWIERTWANHLKPHFGNMVAQTIRLSDFDRYLLRRKNEGASICTRNREITILKMIFNHARKDRRIPIPEFPERQSEKPFVRHGTIDVEQYKALVKKAEPWLATLLTIYFKYGFRKSELLSMRVRDVDLKTPMLILPPFRAKNNLPRRTVIQKDGNIFKMVSELVEGKSPDDFVFTRPNGQRVRDFHCAWNNLVEGLTCGSGKNGKVTIHDLRRSAVTQMHEKGLDQASAMNVAGHLTMDVHNRYINLSEKAKQENAAAIEGD